MLDPLPGKMSATIVVPAAVPSLRQSSRPCAASSARKYSTPFSTVSWSGRESVTPWLMSATIQVPCAVPSLRQSSFPCVPSFAEK